jgi:hypothetical protein
MTEYKFHCIAALVEPGRQISEWGGAEFRLRPPHDELVEDAELGPYHVPRMGEWYGRISFKRMDASLDPITVFTSCTRIQHKGGDIGEIRIVTATWDKYSYTLEFVGVGIPPRSLGWHRRMTWDG